MRLVEVKDSDHLWNDELQLWRRVNNLRHLYYHCVNCLFKKSIKLLYSRLVTSSL